MMITTPMGTAAWALARCTVLFVAFFMSAVVELNRTVGQPSLRRVSVDSNGVQGDDWSNGPTVVPSGRFILFTSEATNLVPHDTNGFEDLFLHDMTRGTTEILSVSSDEEQGRDDSRGSARGATPNGRYIAFASSAWNFDQWDEKGSSGSDIFVRDRVLGTTTLVSVSSDGIKGNGQSSSPGTSADGRYVVFRSSSNDLVEDDTNRRRDLFLHDRDADENGEFDDPGGISTTRITVGYDGTESDGSSYEARMTPDGRFIAFHSDATNLVEGDTNRSRDVFVYDRDADEDGVFDEPGEVLTERVSVSSDGWEAEEWSARPSISDDGRFVAFESVAQNISCCDRNEMFDVFLRDRELGITWIVSLSVDGPSGNGGSVAPSMSPDGRFVAFSSAATNLVENDDNGYGDAFLYDRITRETTLVSLSVDGEQGNHQSGDIVLTRHGCAAVFSSLADNLVEGDTNESQDIFYRDLGWCVPGDIDGDGVTGRGDFIALEACMSGPGTQPPYDCLPADLDLDLDVDLYDFTILQANYTGE